MSDYQKERINKLFKNEWEKYRRHADALSDPCLSDPAKAGRHSAVMSESLAWMNGMRETLEILGYQIRYEDHSYPQVV